MITSTRCCFPVVNLISFQLLLATTGQIVLWLIFTYSDCSDEESVKFKRIPCFICKPTKFSKNSLHNVYVEGIFLRLKSILRSQI